MRPARASDEDLPALLPRPQPRERDALPDLQGAPAGEGDAMTCRAQEYEIPLYHDLNFSDPTAPFGYGRCIRCGQLVNRDLWAAQPCPGPTPEETT